MTGVNYLAEWQIEFIAKHLYYEDQVLWPDRGGEHAVEWDDVSRPKRDRYKDLAKTAIGALDELGYV